MNSTRALTIALALCLTPNIAIAATPYSHQQSGIALPDRIGGLERGELKEFQKEVDVMTEYLTADRSEVLSVYIFRNVSGNASLWFDRASHVLENNETLGEKTAAYAPRSFVPKGQSNPSGLRVAYDLSGTRYKSSAIAIAPVEGWYVKIRASSVSQDSAAIDAWIDEALAALTLPESIMKADDAAPIAPCADSLKFAAKTKALKDKNNSMVAALFGAVIAAQVEENKKVKGSGVTSAPVIWCRDSHAIERSAVYRANGSKDSYLLAFEDSGRAMSIWKDGLTALVSESKQTQYSVQALLLGETLVFAPRDGLPTPEKAQEIFDSEDPVSATNVGTKNITIQAN